MTAVSDWYPTFGYLTFPTIFVGVTDAEAKTLAAAESGAAQRSLIKKLHAAIKSTPGSAFVQTDVCSPKDASAFARGKGAVRSGNAAWHLLADSAASKDALHCGVRKLCVRPFRRMDTIREFRLFIRDGRLLGISQMNLTRHFARLDGRRKEIAQKADKLVAEMHEIQPLEAVAIDVYLTSSGELLVVDFNPWGAPTDPLLLRSWDRDWSEPVGLKLIEKPTKLGGDVEVSF